MEEKVLENPNKTGIHFSPVTTEMLPILRDKEVTFRLTFWKVIEKTNLQTTV